MADRDIPYRFPFGGGAGSGAAPDPRATDPRSRVRSIQPDLTHPNYGSRPEGAYYPGNTSALRQRELQRVPDLNLLKELYEEVKKTRENTDVDVLLRTLGLSFTPQTFSVGTTPVQIIDPGTSSGMRGYLIINPGEITGFGSTFTFLPLLLRTPGTYTSLVATVSGVLTATAFLNVTVQAAGATLTVRAQTQDPLSANFASAQADIFSSQAAVGTYSAFLGQNGIDRFLRLQAVVGVANETFSLSGTFKGNSLTPVGSTVYIGGPNIIAGQGFSIMPGGKELLVLRSQVPLFAVSALETINLRILKTQ